MALDIRLSQKLTQTLAMTPQLQQAIKLLQLGRLEYKEAIEKELLENPVLEEIIDEPEKDTPQHAKKEELRETEDAPINPREGESPIEWDDYLANFSDYRASSKGSSDSEDRPSLEATLTKGQDLAEHIVSQICVSELSQKEKEVLLQIVGNLDPDGYLCISNEEIVEESHCSEEELENVLDIIHNVDPAGLAARDLKECLILQLDRIGLTETLAGKIVKEYLPQLENRQYEKIMKAENATKENLQAAIATIQKLDPKPGRAYSEDDTRYIVPDIYVIKDGKDYVVTLNEDGLPKLRVSPYYLQLMNENAANESSDNRAYLNDRLKAASWLIKSIHQRQNTIFRVAESIVKFQREFLDKGIAYLKPLVLKDVATDIGMHESTISRVTTNKYIHTPQGVFELKYFFTTALKGDEGSVSSSSVKEKIRTIIAGESPENPISDQQLVEMLAKENITIARRTVAKYRESLGILSSSKRKKIL